MKDKSYSNLGENTFSEVLTIKVPLKLFDIE
jgi:hypothetical protein